MTDPIADVPREPSVVVKPLEWVEVKSPGHTIQFKAESIMGAYLVWGWPGGQWTYSGMLYGFKDGFMDADKAKAAAQAAYEQRILTAIDPTPSTDTRIADEVRRIAQETQTNNGVTDPTTDAVAMQKLLAGLGGKA